MVPILAFTITHTHLDLNECETLNGGCQQQCINTNGSFNCQCRNGFFLNGNGRTCAGKLAPCMINSFLENPNPKGLGLKRWGECCQEISKICGYFCYKCE